MALDGDNHITIDWSCDCDEQRTLLSTMFADIEAQDEIIRDAGRQQLQIFSKNPPSTAQWQTEWLLRGNSLPLPDGLELLWFDTTNNDYGAQYYVVSGEVYPVEMLRYRGLVNAKKNPDTTSNLNVALGASTAGLLHWHLTNNGTGSPGAVSWSWTIPAHLLGKNYFFKFALPFFNNPGPILNWTIWYEGTNFYNTLHGGVGENGFGRFPAAASVDQIIEWTAEIPAGGAVTTIEVRLASLGVGVTIQNPVGWGFSYKAGLDYGRAIAEFILKTE